MGRYLRFKDYTLNEASKSSKTNAEKAILDLSGDQKINIKIFVEDYFKSVLSSILKDNWIVTYYDTVIKIRTDMGNSIKENMKGGDLKKFNTDLSFVVKGKPKTGYQRGLSLVLYLLSNGHEDRVLINPKDTLKKEKIALKNINKLIKNWRDALGGPFKATLKDDDGKLLFNNTFAKDFVEIPKRIDDIKGVPRADFVLRDDSGKDILFISHKDGFGIKGFQQYSGMSNDSNIRDHEEVKDFTNKIKNHFESLGTDMLSQPSGTYFATPIKDINLVGLSLFGNNFGSTKFDKHNCSVLFQGSIILEPVPNNDVTMSISASGHTLINPFVFSNSSKNLKLSNDDEYWPALVCFKANIQNQFGIPGARFYIWPQGHAHVQRGIDAFNKI